MTGAHTGSTSSRPAAAIALEPADLVDRLFSEHLWSRLASVVQVDRSAILTDLGSSPARDRLATVDVLITGWGCDPIDDRVLDAAPRLRAIVHAGGAVSAQLGPQAAHRGIALSNAGAANAIPVAEYTLAMILLANKAAFRAQRDYRARQRLNDRLAEFAEVGNLAKVVGIVSASRIGRRVIELLEPFDLDVVVTDPLLTDGEAAALGLRRVPLDELLRTSDVVSLHPPVLPTTTGMIGAGELALLRDGATLINTSRGVIVDQDALVAELATGRIEAVLDVTEPDVLPAGHPLYTLPNVVLTPHIAGSLGTELHRLGSHVVDELARFARGDPFAYAEAPPVPPSTD